MRITAQTMTQSGIELSIESSCDNKWDITIYKNDVDEELDSQHKKLLSDYLTIDDLKALEDLFYKARYLAQENTEEQK